MVIRKKPPSEKISPAQARVLQQIEEGIATHGRAPTYREIAQKCGYEAVGTVQDHIQALLKKGFLKKEPGIARGLCLTHHTQATAREVELFKTIPILGMVPAGVPLEMIEARGDHLGTLSVPHSWKGELFALRVKGDSMIEAGILENDYVIVKKQNDAKNGDIVVASLNGEATVKYLEKKNGTVKLVPANPHYSPIVITQGTSPGFCHRSEDQDQTGQMDEALTDLTAEIIGRVISLQRLYSD